MFTSKEKQSVLSTVLNTPARSPIMIMGVVGSGRETIFDAVTTRILSRLGGTSTERALLVETSNRWVSGGKLSSRNVLVLSLDDPRGVYWDVSKDLVDSIVRTRFVDAVVGSMPDTESLTQNERRAGSELLLAAIDLCYRGRASWTWQDLALTVADMPLSEIGSQYVVDALAGKRAVESTMAAFATSFTARRTASAFQFSLRDWYRFPAPALLGGRSPGSGQSLKNKSALVIPAGRLHGAMSVCLLYAVTEVLNGAAWHSEQGKTWLVVDDVLETFVPLDLGLIRSTGRHNVQVVLSCRDLSQIQALYGPEERASLASEATFVVARCNDPITKDTFCAQRLVPETTLAMLGAKPDGVLCGSFAKTPTGYTSEVVEYPCVDTSVLVGA